MTEDIKINAISSRVRYVADGTTDTFVYIFPIFETHNMNVYIDDELQQNGYSVSGVGDSNGGEIKFDIPPANGKIVTLLRNLEIKRTSDFQEGGAFRAKAINHELDYQIACIQQLYEQINRSVIFPPYSQIQQSITLPIPEAGKALIWNDDASALCNSFESINEIEKNLSTLKDDAILLAQKAEKLNSNIAENANLAQTSAQTAQNAAQQAIDTINEFSQQINNKAENDLSNVSTVDTNFKEQATRWGLPDYDSTVSIDVAKGSNTWTAPIDCFVHISSQGTGQCTASLGNETNELWYSRVDNTNTTAKICSASAFIDKGRTITIQYTGTLNYCYYAPLKGVN